MLKIYYIAHRYAQSYNMFKRKFAWGASLTRVILIALFCLTEMAQAEDKQTLVIVTPHPHELTHLFQAKFEQRNPKISLQILKQKNTQAAIELLLSKQGLGFADLFWASSPDVFELLKANNKLRVFKPAVKGIPEFISGIRLNDAENYYTGFALSGYGFVWNKRYLRAKKIPQPRRWKDLTRPYYRGHLAMSTPTLSGTTHTLVETILQTHGWDEGWKLLKLIAANMKAMVPSSYGVVKKVADGEFAIGTAVDFYGLSMRAKRYPVYYNYPERPTLLTENIALLKDASNVLAGEKFIEFLLSSEGQYLLLDKQASRLPIRHNVYTQVSENYPNPFTDTTLQQSEGFDAKQAMLRYPLVNRLYDKVITFNATPLKAASLQLQCLEQRLLANPNTKAETLLKQAEEALYWLPVNKAQSVNTQYINAFNQQQKAHGGYYEQGWGIDMLKQYKQAIALAESAIKLIAADKPCQTNEVGL